MKISASIVTYNDDIKLLKKALKSFDDISIEEKELVVVDNSSNKEIKRICKKFDSVRYIASENIGFGAGHNIAFRNLEKSDIYLVINPDVYFCADEMIKFLEWFYSEDSIALATPMVLNFDGSVQNTVREIPTVLSLFKRKLGIDRDELDIEKNIIKELPFAHGCFLAFKSDVFEKLGGFDERFFLYMEDVDIYIRAKEYGKTVINSNYHIFHKHNKESRRDIKMFLIHLVSAWKFFIKYR